MAQPNQIILEKLLIQREGEFVWRISATRKGDEVVFEKTLSEIKTLRQGRSIKRTLHAATISDLVFRDQPINDINAAQALLDQANTDLEHIRYAVRVMSEDV